MAGARAALDRAIAARPDLAEAYLFRALVTSEDHPLAASRGDFEYALQLDPKQVAAHRYFGEALETDGDVAGAEKHYREALALSPDELDVLYLYGRLRLRR